MVYLFIYFFDLFQKCYNNDRNEFEGNYHYVARMCRVRLRKWGNIFSSHIVDKYLRFIVKKHSAICSALVIYYVVIT